MSNSAEIAKALEAAGFKMEQFTVRINPKVHEDVVSFLTRLHEAHEASKKSTLQFD